MLSSSSSSNSAIFYPLLDEGLPLFFPHMSISCYVAPEKRLISWTHFPFGRRPGRFFFLGVRCSTFVVYLLSVRLAMCPAHLHFIFFAALIISSTFVCARIHSFVFLSLLVIPSVHLSIALCVILNSWVVCAFNVRNAINIPLSLKFISLLAIVPTLCRQVPRSWFGERSTGFREVQGGLGMNCILIYKITPEIILIMPKTLNPNPLNSSLTVWL